MVLLQFKYKPLIQSEGMQWPSLAWPRKIQFSWAWPGKHALRAEVSKNTIRDVVILLFLVFGLGVLSEHECCNCIINGVMPLKNQNHGTIIPLLNATSVWWRRKELFLQTMKKPLKYFKINQMANNIKVVLYIGITP